MGSWDRAGEPGSGPVVGYYSEAWGEAVESYRWEGELHLRLGGELIGLAGCEASWEADAGRGRGHFRLMRGGAVVAEREYALRRELLEFREGDTAIAEAEDFDLLLLVANVLGDAGRRERVFRNG
ncbi:MAG: hypothetical protein J0L64_14220 [Acidobacteria bacterium]|nr:hypothetical protein [Acidobacteriota bacterium]